MCRAPHPSAVLDRVAKLGELTELGSRLPGSVACRAARQARCQQSSSKQQQPRRASHCLLCTDVRLRSAVCALLQGWLHGPLSSSKAMELFTATAAFSIATPLSLRQ